ncbi:hypothetical protein V2I01_32040 [Micromonospora sp. BRA006-A]|nr:hypothetical protein [Micromonospora sp. BRA006-A]
MPVPPPMCSTRPSIVCSPGHAGLHRPVRRRRRRMEFPFAPAGRPSRVAGRAELHDYLIDYPRTLDIREIADVTVRQTADRR